MLQDDYRQLYKKLNPNWQDSVTLYRNLVKKHIHSDAVVLEAGCGFSDMFNDEYKKAKKVIGIDVCESYIEQNPVITEKIVASVEKMPRVKNASIDLIISSWVLEHLKEPELAFLEFKRVLKKGGKVIFLAPNAMNYILIGNRIIPRWFRKLIVKKLAKRTAVDPMPAFYRANTPFKVRKLAKSSGLKLESLILNGDPTYIAVNKFAFHVGRVIEKILSLPFISSTRVHMIGVLVNY